MIPAGAGRGKNIRDAMEDKSMKISQYIKEYTAGKPITLRNVFSEINELILEIIKIKKGGIKEEFEDVFHFLQLWLYWRFSTDGEIWKMTKKSVRKFMDRKQVWNKIYAYVGLPQNTSGYVGNYKKMQKVVSHLQKFGIDKEKAEEAYKKIVQDKI